MVTNNDCRIGCDYRGTSKDVKPANAEVNALFLELDTGEFYYFTGVKWDKVGG